MKVIFKRDLAKVGKKYQIKEVSSGYAANFLIPNGYAVLATPQAEKELAGVLATLEADKKVQHALLQKNLKTISETNLKMTAKANDKGHLFSGVHKEQISEELRKQAGLEVPVAMIQVEKTIKEAGSHKIKIGEGEHVAVLNLEIVGE